MFLALKEMSRAKARFGLLVAAIGMLVFLILFQQAIQTGLINSFIGAIKNQDSPVLVYSVDGRRVIQASVITPDLEAEVRGAEGLGEVGDIYQGTFTAAGVEDENVDITLFGYAAAADGTGIGAPTNVTSGRLPMAPGEVVASTDGELDLAVGDTVRLIPAGGDLFVVGLAEDAQLNVTTTLFGTVETYLEAVRGRNPDAGEPLPNVLGVRPVPGSNADDAATLVNDLSPRLDALPQDEAARSTPGVDSVQQSFRIIFFLYGLVVPCVTGLFFLIVTFQKAGALTLLRAIGAPASRLVKSLLFQVVLIIGSGLAAGTVLFALLASGSPTSVPLRFDGRAVLFWAVLLLGLGIASSLIAARRVLRIDPMTATTGAGVQP